MTTLLYGASWSGDTLLARQRAANLRHDPEAHFEFPYTVLAELSPHYKAFVQSEIRRLGHERIPATGTPSTTTAWAPSPTSAWTTP